MNLLTLATVSASPPTHLFLLEPLTSDLAFGDVFFKLSTIVTYFRVFMCYGLRQGVSLILEKQLVDHSSPNSAALL